MADEQRRITGAVLRAPIATGSKSARLAVVLRSKGGEQYILRRAGGNAFRDPALDVLVGKTVTATGLVSGRTFIMHKWTTEDGK